MTTLSVIFVVLAGLAAVVDWRSVFLGNEAVEQFAKPSVLVLLIMALATGEVAGGLRLWLLVALFAGLVGDVMLLPAVDRFVVGLGAFLVGHLAYLWAAVTIGTTGYWLVGGMLLSSALIIFVGGAIADAVHETALFVPVLAYIVAIALSTAMLVATGLPLLAIGAVLFAVSDALLGWDRFIGPTPGDRVTVHLTYHLAQMVLVVGFLSQS